MSISKWSAVAVLGLTAGACDRLPERWAFKAEPSSVTIKLPPARAATPGFAFDGEGKPQAAAAVRLRFSPA